MDENQRNSANSLRYSFILMHSWQILNISVLGSVQFSSVPQSCPTLCDPMDCSTPGLHVHHQLPEFTQTHIHWVGDTIQPSYPLSSPSPPAFNLSQHQGLFKWVSSSHQVAKVLELQLQHQSDYHELFQQAFTKFPTIWCLKRFEGTENALNVLL